RVLVLGPKRLLGVVVDEIQRLGILHIDRIEAEEVALTPLALGEEEGKEQAALERLLARVEGLLSLLPPVGHTAPAREIGGLGMEDLSQLLDKVEGEARDFTRRRLEAEEELELIAAYEGAVRVLSPLLDTLSGSRHLESVGFILKGRDLGVLTALRNELVKVTEGRVEVQSRFVEEDKLGVVVAFHRRDAEAVRSLLGKMGISELRLPARFANVPAQEAIEIMERRKGELPQVIQEAQEGLRRLAEEYRGMLLAARALIQDRLAQLRVLPNFAQTRFTFLIHGWAPSHLLPRLRAALGKAFGSDLVIYDEPAGEEEAEEVPVLLDNPPFIRPFQRLLALFRPPRYGFWDPSPVFAITFPVFIGLVIGDVGYGLLVFLLGWWLRNRARAGVPLDIGFLNLHLPAQLVGDISFLVRTCAVWIIAFGAVYGELFGNLPELLFHYRPFFNRVEETTTYFLLIILVGVVMIYLGLVIHLFLAIRHRHTTGIFESLTMILGVTALLLVLGTMGGMLPPSMMRPGLLAGLATLVVAGLSRKAGSMMWILESFTSFGHILSHARLLAFGLAAALLANTANQLGQRAGALGAITGVFIAAVFHTIFFVLTIFGHVIQPARLHWVEFLTKFKYHEETGRPYQPFHKVGGE
ncbi:MAG: V-type ATPase 116kDa subunit family protein, partial [Armatimonadota bacterium]|nr:V-type ATPase 116kDa subunit family protein [Armatimonadota bacterium]